MSGVRWKDQPDEHDDPAAASYLALIADPATVADEDTDLPCRIVGLPVPR